MKAFIASTPPGWCVRLLNICTSQSSTALSRKAAMPSVGGDHIGALPAARVAMQYAVEIEAENWLSHFYCPFNI